MRTLAPAEIRERNGVKDGEVAEGIARDESKSASNAKPSVKLFPMAKVSGFRKVYIEVYISHWLLSRSLGPDGPANAHRHATQRVAS
jgi:hypothetical protein